MGKRYSVFAITEDGKTHYCKSKQYGGIGGLTLRFSKNEIVKGVRVPFFERLNNTIEIDKSEYQEYLDHPEDADVLVSLVEVNVDEDIIRFDEDMQSERIYREYPLSLLVAEGKHQIRARSQSGYDMVDKDNMYRHMDMLIGKEPWQKRHRYSLNFNRFATIRVTENGLDEYFMTQVYYNFTLAADRYREYCGLNDGMPMSELFADRDSLSETGYFFLCDNFSKNPYLRNMIEFNVDEQVARLLKKGEEGWKEYSLQEVVKTVGRMHRKDLTNTAVSWLENMLNEKSTIEENVEQEMQIPTM